VAFTGASNEGIAIAKRKKAPESFAPMLFVRSWNILRISSGSTPANACLAEMRRATPLTYTFTEA
jgi:hypothetical protein